YIPVPSSSGMRKNGPQIQPLKVSNALCKPARSIMLLSATVRTTEPPYSRLALRTPVQIARADLLEHDLSAADTARQAGAVVHPVPVVAAGHRRPVRIRRQPVHGHHLPGLDADRQQS